MENILLLIAGILLAAYMGRRIIPKILIISMRKRLFDVPDERKVHKRPVPRLGGVSFFPVILFVICILTMYRVIVDQLPNPNFTIDNTTEMLSLFAGLTLLYVVGIGDDLVGIRYRNKFKIQIIASALFPIAGLYINNFYGLLGIHELSPYFGIPLTMVLVIFITNAINLIDGIDGLASSICIVALSTFGMLFIQDNMWLFAQTAFISVGILLPFFAYNVFGNAERGRKIFMGDTGSLTLGYILSFLVIKHCMYVGDDTVQTEGAPIILAFSILLVPCLDVIRVVLGRLRRHKNPFLPDKTHIHHKFMSMGFSPRSSLILIQCISVTLITISMLLNHYHVDVNLIFLLDIAIWTGLNIWFTRIIKRKKESKL